MDKFRRKLNNLINETLKEYKHQRDIGGQIEVEMIRMCSITNINLVLQEKEKIKAEYGDGYISTAMGCD